MSKLSRLQNWISFKHYWMFWRGMGHGPLHELWWKFNHRFVRKHQYNRLDTGLPPGYYDPDTQILYAVMNCFRRFMEKGAPEFSWGDEPVSDYIEWYTNADGTVDQDGLNAYQASLQTKRDLKTELDSIYDWWVNRYLKTLDFNEACWRGVNLGKVTLTDVDTKQMFDLEEQLEIEANEQLAKLMKHRCSLWYA